MASEEMKAKIREWAMEDEGTPNPVAQPEASAAVVPATLTNVEAPSNPIAEAAPVAEKQLAVPEPEAQDDPDVARILGLVKKIEEGNTTEPVVVQPIETFPPEGQPMATAAEMANLSEGLKEAEQKKLEREAREASTPEAAVPEAGVVLPRAENDQEEDRKEKITKNLEFVLDKVPELARSSTAEHDKYKEEIDEAKAQLLSEGIDVDKYVWSPEVKTIRDPKLRNDENGRRKRLLLNYVKYLREGGKVEEMTDEQQDILRETGIKAENLLPVAEEDKVIKVVDVPKKREPVEKERKIGTKEDVDAEIVRLSQLAEPGLRSMAFKDLARQALKIPGVPMEVVNRIAELAESSRLEAASKNAKKSNEAPELKELDTDEKWIKWGRERLALFLSPDSEQTLRSMGGGVFNVQRETIYGKQWVDGTPYMPESVQNQMRVEFTTAQELRTTFNNWKTNHERLDNLANEKLFVAFSNEQVGRILNSLRGENGIPGEGSKNVARAIALYARMAVTPVGQTSNLESEVEGDGLDEEVQSIFNTVLSSERVTRIRKEIAEKCGGGYYESLALMLAKMMGVAAKGSDSLKPGIENADCVGRLMFTRRWNSEAEATDRWLPQEMAVDQNGHFLFLRRTKTGDYHHNSSEYQIQLAVDAFGMQFKGEPGKKNYCLVDVGGKYRAVSTKELTAGEVDSGKNMVELLLGGQLDSVDWKGSSFEFLNGIKGRNVKSFDVYTMLRETLDAKGTIDLNLMEKKRELINGALGHYGDKTKYWVGYLYIESWIRRHSADWLKRRYGNSSEESRSMVWSPDKMKSFIQKAKMAGLIDDELAHILNKHYKTGFFNL